MPQQARKLTDLLDEREQWRKEIGVFFREVRMAQPTNTSQVYFANDVLGISQSYLSQIEHGQRTPSSETLNKLRSVVEGGTSAPNTSQKQAPKEGDEA